MSKTTHNNNTQTTNTVNPTTNEALIAQNFDKALSKTTNWLRHQYHFDLAASEALAAQGVEYAANYYLRAHPEETPTFEKLSSLAIWATANRAKDALRYQKKHPELQILDDTGFEDDGETLTESPLLQTASDRAWRTHRYDEDWYELGAYAMSRLEEMFDLLKLSPLRRQVFRAVYLEQECLKDVCARHHIKPNYAYGIVFGVKAKLAAVGPAFLAAA